MGPRRRKMRLSAGSAAASGQSNVNFTSYRFVVGNYKKSYISIDEIRDFREHGKLLAFLVRITGNTSYSFTHILGNTQIYEAVWICVWVIHIPKDLFELVS